MGILYIVDDLMLLESTEASFKFDPEVTVEVASSGRDALRRMRNEPFDAVRLYAVMLGICGPDVLAEIILASPEPPPVLLVTGLTLGHPQAELMVSGAAGVITKPLDPFSLPRRVRAMVEMAHAQRRANTQARAKELFQALARRSLTIGAWLDS